MKINIPAIEAENIYYSYKAFQSQDDDSEKVEIPVEIPAVRDASFSVKKGEFVAVLGHNGSGKSTLAKLINALLIPDKGKMRVFGLDNAIEENVWLVRQSAGMVFQNPDNQIIATIVEEDVAFGPENLGVPSQEIRKRVDWALGIVGMSEYAEHSPHFLSGGQKQRVSIAGVLAMKTDIIILDEPTAMLDPVGRREVLAAVSRLNKEEGMTVVLITHYMEEAVMADRVIVMDGGGIVMDAPPREAFSQAERLRSLGLDVPQVTEIGRRIREAGYDVPLGVLSVEELTERIMELVK